MEHYRINDYNKVDLNEQTAEIEEIAEALEYLRGEHKKFFNSLYEAEKEE